MQDNLKEKGCGQVREDILLADFAKDDGKGVNGFVLSSRALAHAQACEPCREYISEVRDAARAVRMLHAGAPADFMEGLHEKLLAGTPRLFFLFPVWKPVAAAAALLFVFLTAFSTMHDGLTPGNLSSERLRPGHGFDFLSPSVARKAPLPGDRVSSPANEPSLVKAVGLRNENIKKSKAALRVTSAAPLSKKKKTAVVKALRAREASSGDRMSLLHGQMLQIQVSSNKSADNVSLVIETGGDAALEGEQKDEKVLTWLGPVSSGRPAALLVPVKARGGKTVNIKTTVVTSEGEILHGSASFKAGKKTPVIAAPGTKHKAEKIPGRFLVFIPSSHAKPEHLPVSGISVSVQTGSLALSDASVENVAYVPNPGGSLELVFADSTVSLEGVQVTPEKE